MSAGEWILDDRANHYRRRHARAPAARWTTCASASGADAATRWAACAGADGEMGVPYCCCWPCMRTRLAVSCCCWPCTCTWPWWPCAAAAGRALLLLLAVLPVAPCPAVVDVHRMRGTCFVTHALMCVYSGVHRFVRFLHRNFFLRCVTVSSCDSFMPAEMEGQIGQCISMDILYPSK